LYYKKDTSHKHGRKRKRTPQNEVRVLGAAICRWFYAIKKIDAINAGNKVTKKKNLRSRIAHRRRGLRYKKHRRY
jgi:hypothetical protein